jgi:hypothetical protein
MTARTIVGATALLALLAVAIYLLAQIPWEFTLGGLLALAGIWLAIGRKRSQRPVGEGGMAPGRTSRRS